MEFCYKVKEDVTGSVALLISILIRYPEVATINFDPEQQVLKFTFILSKVLDSEEFEGMKIKLLKSIDVFNTLESKKVRLSIIKHNVYDNLTLIEIQRDVDAMVQEEIALIVEFFRSYFPKNLVIEKDESIIIEEELIVQEEIIEHMLESVRSVAGDKRLFAFRDEGRVLVFNK